MQPKRNIKKYAIIGLIASIAMLLLSRLMFDYFYYNYSIEDELAMIIERACYVAGIISMYTGAVSVVVLVIQLVKDVRNKV